MMGFFLLGRSADDTLSLLSARTFDSRQDALAELSFITADPQFSAWDDDVLLFDADSGTPVLLVRPASAPALAARSAEPVATVSPVPLPEPAAFAAVADEPLVVAPIAAATPAETAAAPLEAEPVSSVPVAPDADLAEPESATQPSDDDRGELPAFISATQPQPEVSAYAAPELLGTPLIEPFAAPGPALAADEAVASPDAHPQTAAISEAASPDAALAELFAGVSPDVPTDHTDSHDTNSLRDALTRTTEHMEASGIVAPLSVGPAEPNTSAPVETIAAAPAAPEPAVETEPDATEHVGATAAVESSEAPAHIDAPSVPAWPWDTPISEPASVELGTPAEAPATVPPVESADYERDTARDDPRDEASNSIAAPLAPDGTSALESAAPGTGGDTSPVDAARIDARAEAPHVAPSDGSAPAVAESLPEPEPAAESEPSSPFEALGSPTDEGASDFVVLDTPVAEPSVVSAPSVLLPDSQDVPPLSSYTCNDCVYVETCPNRDQRLPKDCVSFQWK